MPIDRPSNRGYVLLPLAAPHHRREGLIHERPSTRGQAKQSPLPAAVEATTRMTYRHTHSAVDGELTIANTRDE